MDFFHGLVGGNGQDVDGQHEAAVKVGQVGDHIVLNIAGVLLEKEDAPILAAHLKVSGLKGNTVRANQVFEVYPMPDRRSLVEREILFLTGTEKVMEDTEAVMVGNLPRRAVQPSQTFGQVAVHPPEIGTGFLDLPLRDGQGDIFLLHQIVALGGAALQNGVGLLPVLVQPVPAFLHQNTALKVHGIQAAVDNGDLGGGVGGQGVEDAAVGQEDAPPFLVGGGGVVHIGKPPALAVPVPHQPDAVRVHALDGDRSLDAPGDGEFLALALVCGNKGFNQSPALLSASKARSDSSGKQNGAPRRRGFRT